MSIFRSRKRRGVLAKVVQNTGDVHSFPNDIWIKGLEYIWPVLQAVGFLRNNGNGSLTWSPLGASDVPNLDASKITTGVFNPARIPPAEQLNEDGGPTTLDFGVIADGQFLKRTGATVVGAASAGGLSDAQVMGRIVMRI